MSTELLSSLFINDVKNNNETDITPVVLLGNESNGIENLIFLSTAAKDVYNQALNQNFFCYPFIQSIGNISESIDLEKRKFKISSNTIKISLGIYNNTNVTKLIKKNNNITDTLIGTEVRIFWTSVNCNEVDFYDIDANSIKSNSAYFVFTGSIIDSKFYTNHLSITIEDKNILAFSKEIPDVPLPENNESKYSFYPILYGEHKEAEGIKINDQIIFSGSSDIKLDIDSTHEQTGDVILPDGTEVNQVLFTNITRNSWYESTSQWAALKYRQFYMYSGKHKTMPLRKISKSSLNSEFARVQPRLIESESLTGQGTQPEKEIIYSRSESYKVNDTQWENKDHFILLHRTELFEQDGIQARATFDTKNTLMYHWNEGNPLTRSGVQNWLEGIIGIPTSTETVQYSSAHWPYPFPNDSQDFTGIEETEDPTIYYHIADPTSHSDRVAVNVAGIGPAIYIPTKPPFESKSEFSPDGVCINGYGWCRPPDGRGKWANKILPSEFDNDDFFLMNVSLDAIEGADGSNEGSGYADDFGGYTWIVGGSLYDWVQVWPNDGLTGNIKDDGSTHGIDPMTRGKYIHISCRTDPQAQFLVSSLGTMVWVNAGEGKSQAMYVNIRDIKVTGIYDLPKISEKQWTAAARGVDWSWDQGERYKIQYQLNDLLFNKYNIKVNAINGPDTNYAFQLLEPQTLKSIVEESCSASSCIPILSSTGGFRLETIKPQYTTAEVTHFIRKADIIKYKFSLDATKDIVTKIQFHFNWNSVVKKYQSVIEYSDEEYNFDFWGLPADHNGTTKIIKDKRGRYIQDTETAEEFCEHFIELWKNPHLELDLEIPISVGIDMDLGSVIAFNEEFHEGGERPYGHPYIFTDVSELDDTTWGEVINNNQVYPIFIIIDIQKTLSTVKLKLWQPHNMTTNEVYTPADMEPACMMYQGHEINGDIVPWTQPLNLMNEADMIPGVEYVDSGSSCTWYFVQLGCGDENYGNDSGVLLNYILDQQDLYRSIDENGDVIPASLCTANDLHEYITHPQYPMLNSHALYTASGIPWIHQSGECQIAEVFPPYLKTLHIKVIDPQYSIPQDNGLHETLYNNNWGWYQHMFNEGSGDYYENLKIYTKNSRLYDVLAKCKEEANLKFWIKFTGANGSSNSNNPLVGPEHFRLINKAVIKVQIGWIEDEEELQDIEGVNIYKEHELEQEINEGTGDYTVPIEIHLPFYIPTFEYDIRPYLKMNLVWIFTITLHDNKGQATEYVRRVIPKYDGWKNLKSEQPL